MERKSKQQLAGKIGGLMFAATNDTGAAMARARSAFMASFERAVDPEGTLPAEERARRADAARRAHFARLALRSAAARSARKHPAMPV